MTDLRQLAGRLLGLEGRINDFFSGANITNWSPLCKRQDTGASVSRTVNMARWCRVGPLIWSDWWLTIGPDMTGLGLMVQLPVVGSTRQLCIGSGMIQGNAAPSGILEMDGDCAYAVYPNVTWGWQAPLAPNMQVVGMALYDPN